MNPKSESNIIVKILWLIVFFGIIISITNLVYNRSLWGDEAMLALNISEKSYFQLLKPLEMNQVAPIGFLIAEKLLINLLGNHDWVFRIIPYTSFLLSILFLYKINQKVFNNEIISLTSSILFVCNASIFYYSNEVKQYSSDTCISLLLIFTFIKNSEFKNTKQILITTFVGIFSILFSNTTIITLLSLSFFNLSNSYNKEISINYKKTISLLICFFSFAIYYILFIKDHPTQKFMVDYWSARKAFPPENILSPEFRLFLFRKTKMLFSSYSEFGNVWVIIFVLFFIGIYFVYKKEKRLILLILPLLCHFILSIFKLYPFETRMLLYTIPMISTFISFGLFYVINNLSRHTNPKALYIIPIVLFFLLIQVSYSCPVKKEEIKPCLQFVNKEMLPGENIYVYYMANPAFQFYKNEYKSISKSSSTVIGNWHIHGCGKSFLGLKQKKEEYINNEELIRIKGRIWLLFTNVSESNYFKIDGLTEDQYLLKNFIKNGSKVLKMKKYFDSICYLIEN